MRSITTLIGTLTKFSGVQSVLFTRILESSIFVHLSSLLHLNVQNEFHSYFFKYSPCTKDDFGNVHCCCSFWVLYYLNISNISIKKVKALRISQWPFVLIFKKHFSFMNCCTFLVTNLSIQGI